MLAKISAARGNLFVLLCAKKEMQVFRAGVLQNRCDKGDEGERKRSNGMTTGIALVCFLVVEMLGRD